MIIYFELWLIYNLFVNTTTWVFMPVSHNCDKTKGRRQNNYKSDQSVKGGGRNQNIYFSYEKEKKMQNVLKWKNMQKIFCDIFARVSVKTWSFFHIYFHKILKVF